MRTPREWCRQFNGALTTAGWEKLEQIIFSVQGEALEEYASAIAEARAAAIEECAKVAERGADEGPVLCDRRDCIAAEIRALASASGGGK